MDLSEFQTKIGYKFNAENLLRQALTHSSYANEFGCADNERLEFLGDAVIGFMASRYLFEKFPERSEGELSALKSVMVSSDFLGRVAEKLGIGERVLLGRGEERTGGRRKVTILTGAFEAIAGAVVIDGGVESAGRFLAVHLAAEIEKTDKDFLKSSYKGLLQEYAQSAYGLIPDYRVKDEGGEGEGKKFAASVSVNNKIIAGGMGKSKKEAETEAAKKALEKIKTGNFC